MILIDDLTANEQNALGNWLMLTAQVLCTNAFYKQVQAERGDSMNNYFNKEDTINIMEECHLISYLEYFLVLNYCFLQVLVYSLLIIYLKYYYFPQLKNQL